MRDVWCWARWVICGVGVICLLACETPKAPNDRLPVGALQRGSWAVVVGRSEQSGALGVVDLDQQTPYKLVGPASNDAVARVWGDTLYIINRYTHDNIQVMDLRDLRLLAQYSVGVGANPQDLVVVGTKAYISCLGRAALQVVDAQTGQPHKEIDLSGLSEVGTKPCQGDADCGGTRCLGQLCALDDLPELGRMFLYAQRWLYVLVQRLDQQRLFSPTSRGLLALIDTQSDTLVQTFPMQGSNPLYLSPSVDGKHLYIAQVGQWMDEQGAPALDGVLERFSLEARRFEGVILREDALGGNLGSFAMIDESSGVVIRTGAAFRTELIRFDSANSRVFSTWASSACTGGVSCFSFVQVAKSPKGGIVLLDRYEKKPGIRLFDTLHGREKTTEPLDIGLPPEFVVFAP